MLYVLLLLFTKPHAVEPRIDSYPSLLSKSSHNGHLLSRVSSFSPGRPLTRSLPVFDMSVTTEHTREAYSTNHTNSTKNKTYKTALQANTTGSSFVILSIFSILTMLVPLWLIIISLVFFYFSKLIFSVFIQYEDHFVRG